MQDIIVFITRFTKITNLTNIVQGIPAMVSIVYNC